MLRVSQPHHGQAVLLLPAAAAAVGGAAHAAHQLHLQAGSAVSGHVRLQHQAHDLNTGGQTCLCRLVCCVTRLAACMLPLQGMAQLTAGGGAGARPSCASPGSVTVNSFCPACSGNTHAVYSHASSAPTLLLPLVLMLVAASLVLTPSKALLLSSLRMLVTLLLPCTLLSLSWLPPPSQPQADSATAMGAGRSAATALLEPAAGTVCTDPGPCRTTTRRSRQKAINT